MDKDGVTLPRLLQPDFNDIYLSRRQVPIVVKLDTDARKDLEQLGRPMCLWQPVYNLV